MSRIQRLGGAREERGTGQRTATAGDEAGPSIGATAAPTLAPWRRIGLGLAGLHGAMGVAAGAIATHGQILLVDMVETGARYQVLHAVALLALALAPTTIAPRILVLAGGLWAGGALVFSGGLYLKAAGVLDPLWRAIPAGGIALILGWVTLLLLAMIRRRP
jgi:uncharacterized membrane protein YgdD (TMEM256/DUF423 family)